jgi:hypothetical protein
MACYEAIEEHQLLESLYSFQQQRQQQVEQQQQQQQPGQKVSACVWAGMIECRFDRSGSGVLPAVPLPCCARPITTRYRDACSPLTPTSPTHRPPSKPPKTRHTTQGPGINLAAASKLLAPHAGSGRTVRLLGGGLFDLEKGLKPQSGAADAGGGGGEGEPMLSVASPFVRLRDGRIVPLRTLNEEQGDFVCLTHIPAPQEEDNPSLRLGRVLPYLRSLMPTFLSDLRCVLRAYVCVCVSVT